MVTRCVEFRMSGEFILFIYFSLGVYKVLGSTVVIEPVEQCCPLTLVIGILVFHWYRSKQKKKKKKTALGTDHYCKSPADSKDRTPWRIRNSPNRRQTENIWTISYEM